MFIVPGVLALAPQQGAMSVARFPQVDATLHPTWGAGSAGLRLYKHRTPPGCGLLTQRDKPLTLWSAATVHSLSKPVTTYGPTTQRSAQAKIRLEFRCCLTLLCHKRALQ